MCDLCTIPLLLLPELRIYPEDADEDGSWRHALKNFPCAILTASTKVKVGGGQPLCLNGDDDSDVSLV